MTTSAEDEKQARMVERERAIASARVALRAEQEQVAADKAETARLLAEARTANREANRARDRARQLGKRFVQRIESERNGLCRQIEEREAKLAADRERLAVDRTHFETVRSEFHVNAAAARDRLRDSWIAVKAQQERAAREWTEANRHFTQEAAVLDVRVTEVTQSEKTLSDNRARIEAETAGLREEAAALESRIESGRASLAELELRRDRARAELLNTEFPAELASEATDVDDLAHRERMLARDKAAVAAIEASLAREAADVRDRRRMLIEQFTLLVQARAKWQNAERQTVLEMEELVRELAHREQEIDEREQRVIRADVRRRNDAYDLWQFRLRLEAWQSKLTAFEMQWHAERELRESNLDRRIASATHREAEVEEAFRRCEQARTSERERLRGELALWSADRERFLKAVASFDRQRSQLVDELKQHAARALAAEQSVGERQGNGSARVARRLTVLRRRWEREFDRKAREIERQSEDVCVERTKLDERYRTLQALLDSVLEREASLNDREIAADLRKAIERGAACRPERSPIEESPDGNATSREKSDSSELVALRAEVERLALVLMDVERPDPSDVPPEQLPWAIEEARKPTEEVLPFRGTPQAA